MKLKTVLTLFIAVFALSLSANSFAYKEKTSKDHKKQAKALLKKNKCLTCHNVKKKLVGPSYEDVAKRYLKEYWTDEEKLFATLSSKIKAGGTGNWGKEVMTPNTEITDDELKVVLKYILNLKYKGRKGEEKEFKK